MEYSLLIKLIVAHLLSDFVFQPTKWAKEKDRNGFSSGYLYLHILVTGIIAQLIVWDLSLLLAVGLLTFFHGLTDGFKGEVNKRFLHKLPSIYLFIIDQIIHLLTIVVIWIVITNQTDLFYSELAILLDNQKFWLYLLGYIWISIPVAVIIGKLTERWSIELILQTSEMTKTKKSGLENAGKWIGSIERILIITFIFIQQFAAIGFMLAAKSIFRFGDLKDSKDHQKTEYIIIGTFLSFMISILTGIALNYFTR
jgi:hypothetical protein